MFIVGPSKMFAPFERTWFPISSPTSRRRSTSHVAPRDVPHGIAADVVLPQPRPRAPCGPSVTHMRGMPSRSTFVVDMKSEPWQSATFSSSVSSAISWSVSVTGSG